MKRKFVIISFIISLLSCQKEEIELASNVSETFYVENKGASMRVLVEGNTASKMILLFVHGGPGSSSYFYNTDYISNSIESKYAVAYWDQRNAGASQGNSNAENFTLETMTEDLKKVILVLKQRYGQKTKVFIVGHSFGGMLSANFVTQESNQSLINGWIVVSGSHNYPLNNKLTIEGMKTYANQEIAKNKHTKEWQEILDYCNSLPDQLTLEQANKLNSYAADTEYFFDEVEPFDLTATIKDKAKEQNYAIISALVNSKNSQNAKINEDLANHELTSKLSTVTVPVLTLFGKYDLICPPGLGDEIVQNVSSAYTKQVILPNSSHVGMIQDEELFCKEVLEFMDRFKE